MKKISFIFMVVLLSIGLAACGDEPKAKSKKQNSQSESKITDNSTSTKIGDLLDKTDLKEYSSEAGWGNMDDTEFYQVDEVGKIIFIEVTLDESLNFPISKDKLIELAKPYIPDDTVLIRNTDDGFGAQGYACKSGDMTFDILHSDNDENGKAGKLFITY
ncbi:hypothetical protein X560_0415 [Listeria fleischmannii 1991]|uniref:Lipoprotein n=2 Tax=Listeria fleischmannii TaxID=1069827 RepID=A0A2X3J080_9LIST|nr:hypothetical protein [Listeria fleischmannii]EMG27500.1 hypothetical protein LFLEISCH_10694 [Listeria fleischmannii subsp. fleischmannii LU2006-1]KMT60995.1 hypothetical protein X560_0415 [Listeria fleischmannii 1991]SQC67350.1 Uncharacterised protein [Listeria fleischmannii subsp. fleischmannii]